MNYAERVRRGEIYYIHKTLNDGIELGGSRPGIIISAECINSTNTTVEVVYLTTQPKRDMLTHIEVKATGKLSTALCEQVDTIDTDKIGSYMATLSDEELDRVMQGVLIGMGVDTFGNNEDLRKTVDELNRRLEEEEKFYRLMIERLCNK